MHRCVCSGIAPRSPSHAANALCPEGVLSNTLVLILLLLSNAMSNLRLATSMPTTQAVSSIVRTFLVCRLWLQDSRPKLPFGLIEREMNRSTYLTHRFMHLMSYRCLAVQPAQH